MQPPHAPVPQSPGEQYGMTPGASQPRGISPIEAVKFLFSDQDWKTSMLFAFVFLIIPVVGPIALAGWYCEIHQRLARKHPRPIPKLDFGDFGSYIGRGLKPFVVQLVVSMPLGIIFMICYFVAGIGGGLIGAAVGEPLVALLFMGVFALFALCFSIAAQVVVNAAMTRAELTEDIGKSLSFGKIMAYGKATWVQVLIKFFLYGFIAFGIVLCGMLLCFVGMYPAMIVVQLGALHLRWQVLQRLPGQGRRAHRDRRSPAARLGNGRGGSAGRSGCWRRARVLLTTNNPPSLSNPPTHPLRNPPPGARPPSCALATFSEGLGHSRSKEDPFEASAEHFGAGWATARPTSVATHAGDQL